MNLNVGEYTYGQKDIKIIDFKGSSKVNIGKFCSIASYVTIFLDANHRTDWATTYPFGHINQTSFNNFNGKGHPSGNGDVNIGNDVWISQGVSIASGVNIGDGAVIASYSHVVKNVDPYTIVGGNPAKLIKYRFTKKQTADLLNIKWWNWNIKKINENLHLLCSNNIDILINKHIKSATL